MKLIVAVNNKGYIGKDGGMLWRSKEDLQHFKSMTMGCHCLVGHNTYKSLPTLKGRTLIVVGTGYNTLEEGLKQDPEWIIGGGQIYKQTLEMCDELHISIIIDNDDEGDVKFEVPESFPEDKIFYYYFTSTQNG